MAEKLWVLRSPSPHQPPLLFQVRPCGPCRHCTTPSATRHPKKSFLRLQLCWTEQCFFCCFLSTSLPPYLLLCYPSNSALVSKASAPVLSGSEKPLCSLCWVQPLLNTYFRQWLFHDLAFLQIIKEVEPPAGFVDFILGQLNNKYPRHYSPILLSCVVWQNPKNRSHSAQIYCGWLLGIL